MAHGDDRGLRLPPRVAPHQVVIVPILRDENRTEVLETAAEIADDLRAAGVRVRVDDRDDRRPGFKFNEWELKGVPVRVEIGARDLAAGTVTIVRRDSGDKRSLPLARASTGIEETLIGVQASLFEAARNERERRTLCDLSRYDEMIEYLRQAAGFATAPWCGRAVCEARVKEESSATIRCLPLDVPASEPRPCVCCGRGAAVTAVWAQAY
jgi:prolyl-tRNA synthetase